MVWTGDSARHDNDEKIPRTQDEVLSTNRWIAGKFVEAFGNPNKPEKPLSIPVISTFGNNDILPHNILLSGPNKWLKAYTDIWSNFIPEEQRHGFERGGWYYVEVIPRRLAVFSLNTLYFFNNNAAVDGCALRSEPGYEHMEWLRIQLQFMRERGMKAILTGHVPPARTDSKQLWDETCWQKYTLWLQQFRDVVVGGLYGHMNIDHFMLHDTKQVDILTIGGAPSQEVPMRMPIEEELSLQSANDYLEELRENWSSLPNPARALWQYDVNETFEALGKKKKKKKKGKSRDRFKKIGGPWGERYQVTLVGPSVVPNFFPTLRVVEYNITGLDVSVTWSNPPLETSQDDLLPGNIDSSLSFEDFVVNIDDEVDTDGDETIAKKKKKHKKPKRPNNPNLIVPSPPTKGSPPGPAYSPQTLTLTGYTQYFANLTHINNDDFVKPAEAEDLDADRWHEGKHKGKHAKDRVPHPKTFQYQVEYDTFTDPIYNLTDLTVRSYVKLARRIGQYKPLKEDEIDEPLLGYHDHDLAQDQDHNERDEIELEGHKKKHKKKKHHNQHEKNKVWLRFVKRAFVGTLKEEELRAFEVFTNEVDIEIEGEEEPSERHNGEL